MEKISISEYDSEKLPRENGGIEGVEMKLNKITFKNRMMDSYHLFMYPSCSYPL
jgi:hypothetical protein